MEHVAHYEEQVKPLPDIHAYFKDYAVYVRYQQSEVGIDYLSANNIGYLRDRELINVF